MNDPTCQKVLVLVGGNTTAPPSRDLVALTVQWIGAGPNHAILPVLPESERRVISRFLPPSASVANAAFWRTRPREAIPAILARASITVETPKIFISYRQVDSSALGIQLFDALSHAGFDVFLDRFRIPPGVNFQSRLTQELGDKSMVLILESEHLTDSEWVKHEIDVAKSCGLGLLALLLPGGAKQPNLDDGNRQAIVDSDFEGGTFSKDAILATDKLRDVVAEIRVQHDRAIVARRRMLEMSFETALRRNGATTFTRLVTGAYDVKAGRGDYLVWLTPRPPETVDFHRVHGTVASSPATGVVIGLSRLMEPDREERVSWLAGLCQITVRDEGQIAAVARDIARGTL